MTMTLSAVFDLKNMNGRGTELSSSNGERVMIRGAKVECQGSAVRRMEAVVPYRDSAEGGGGGQCNRK